MKGMPSTARKTCTALLERPGGGGGVSASVCAIDEKKNNLKVNKIDGFSKLHNFT